MKKILLTLLFILSVFQFINAQNVFPATGNVGIGTATPAYPLDIYTSINGTTAVNFVNASTGTAARTRFVLQNGVGTALINLNSSTYPTDPNSLSIWAPISGAPMMFYTSGGERLRIDASGNVGIGNAAPAYPLDIYTNINGTTAVNFVNASTGMLARTRFVLQNGVGAAVINLNSSTYPTDPNLLSIGAPGGGGSIMFNTLGVERMRVAASGNIGIGTASPANLLTISGSGTVLNVLGNALFGYGVSVAGTLGRSGNIPSGGPTVGGEGFSLSSTVITDAITASGGTAAAGSYAGIGTPTFAANNTSVTYTNAYNLYIGGAPVSGTNVTITKWAGRCNER